MAIGHADGAHVIPLGEEKFQNAAAVTREAFGVGGNFHAFGDVGDAGGEQAAAALDFDQTEGMKILFSRATSRIV